MDKTVESFKVALEEEICRWSGFARALRRPDREAFDGLMNMFRGYASEGSNAANKHPRFKKEVTTSRHEPFGKTSDYIKYVQNANNYRIVKLIKILAMLSQTKVYFFGNKPMIGNETTENLRRYFK